MVRDQPRTDSHRHGLTALERFRHADTYGLVLALILMDYLAVSTVTDNAWGRVLIVILLGLTLVVTLRTSRAQRIWRRLAVVYLVSSLLLTLVSLTVPAASDYSHLTSLLGGLLLLVTPIAIARHLGGQQVVTTEVVLGAVCVYLLIGFSFAFIFIAMSSLSSAPFFVDQAHATTTDFLFFSYTTLTTVGYGNLVPAGSSGQTAAMLEALLGQIYLVIVVARLVSLWGQERPRVPLRQQGAISGASNEQNQQHAADSPAASTEQGETDP
jgi:hypothetical protein